MHDPGRHMVRLAALGELDWCAALDHIPAAILARKIAAEEILIAEMAGERVGFLRLEYLWSEIPYVALIWVLEPYRRQGVGRALLAFLESFLRARGHAVLMSSSQVNEAEPQSWHRHMGFAECGFLAGINPGDVGEVFFRKTL
jgi:GNAT superfamily N-acetyltransferase